MISINEHLDKILSDFAVYLDEGHKLCNLKSVNYDAGKVPSYTDIHIQQYYLLRYAYAYAFEYKCMYKMLFREFAPKNNIKVTSIGCGTMLDYWALVRVLEQKEIPYSIDYTGIDIINWNYQVSTRKGDEVTFVNGDAVESLSALDILPSNIYFFPKSISEFSDTSYSNLCKVFGKTPFAERVVYFMISVRTDKASQERDLRRANQLIQAISENGYSINKDSCKYCRPKDKEEKIHTADSDFDHPSDVVDKLRYLYTDCASYQDKSLNCQEECKIRLGRWPILTKNQVCYTILKFERLS